MKTWCDGFEIWLRLGIEEVRRDLSDCVNRADQCFHRDIRVQVGIGLRLTSQLGVQKSSQPAQGLSTTLSGPWTCRIHLDLERPSNHQIRSQGGQIGSQDREHVLAGLVDDTGGHLCHQDRNESGVCGFRAGFFRVETHVEGRSRNRRSVHDFFDADGSVSVRSDELCERDHHSFTVTADYLVAGEAVRSAR